MRIARIDNDLGKKVEVIEDIGFIKKLKNFNRYGTEYGNCLLIDDLVYTVGENLDQLFENMLHEGFLDLRNYEYFNLGI